MALVAVPGRAVYVFARSGTSWARQAKLTAGDGAQGYSFGGSVALSADGGTALVGAASGPVGVPGNNNGAVYVFARSGTSWARQAELTAGGGAQSDNFGTSVALAGDGSMALVGADFKNNGAGAVYVFARSGKSWAQQAELTAGAGAQGYYFGGSVALAADGGTALVGAAGLVGITSGIPNNNGVVYVFARSGTRWARQAKLTAGDGAQGDGFGASVVLSADGGTALVGAYGHNKFAGAVYVFVRGGDRWAWQAELTAADGAQGDDFGASVALSADGGTALVGATSFNKPRGAAYMFARGAAGWAQQAELAALEGAAADGFGASVALSRDGGTALVGALSFYMPGRAAYVFVRGAAGWVRQAELTAGDGLPGDWFGTSVALSADGVTALVGADQNNHSTGAAYVFVRGAAGWVRQAELTAGDGLPGDWFGTSVALSADGATALVGADGHNNATGAAYLFLRSGTSWSRKAELVAPDHSLYDHFGHSVVLSADGGTALVGAPGHAFNTGVAYLFARGGTSWARQAELAAPGGAQGDDFGASVALSAGGGTALVGAWGHNNTIGAAYLFARGGTSWARQAELAAPDGAPHDHFGFSVALAGNGSTALVGADGYDRVSGAAYLFARSGTSWAQQVELAAADGTAGDAFGEPVSLAADGNAGLMGAHGLDSFTGAAYVFVRGGAGWARQAELTVPDGAPDDSFGSVALSADGDTALVGAYGHNYHTGAAYVFVRDGAGWAQQAELTDADGVPNDSFGTSVALSADGGTALVGAYGHNYGTGAAYLFARGGTSWALQAKLTAGDGAQGDGFGWSVALSADGVTAMVGAPGHNNGAVYVFARGATSWSQQAELTAPGGARGDDFGTSVALSADRGTALVGAPGHNNNGAVYVFAHSGTSWALQAKLTAGDGAPGDWFGTSVALAADGSTALVGAPDRNYFTGAAYLFARGSMSWARQAELVAPDGAPYGFFGESVALSGDGGVALGSGAGSVYAFTRSVAIWSQKVVLGYSFGISVALSRDGSTVLVGDPGHNSSTGAAYLFARGVTTWNQQAELT
jgi:hypothetical protein